MRILIQDPTSKGYFDGQGWGASVEEAREFESVAQAELYCEEQHVTQAFVVLKFNDPKQDIRYPIGPQNAPVVSKSATSRIRRVA